MTNIIAFAPAFNTRGRSDTTGAFQPEAKAFLKFHGVTGGLFLIDNHRTDFEMREQVRGVLTPEVFDQGGKYIAIFCHGLSRQIQFGFDTRNVDQLAEAIGRASRGWPSPVVVLYCCSTARGWRDKMGYLPEPVGGDGGFADALRDALCRAGMTTCQVDAHTTAGHTTRNPYVRRFEGKGSPVGGVGGYFLVAPGSKLWKPWVKALRDTNLRYEFPFMQVSELHERLMGA